MSTNERPDETADAVARPDPAAPRGGSPLRACTWCSADYEQLADRLLEAGWLVQPPGDELGIINALIEIRRVTEASHLGTTRAHAALSQIDQIARLALA